MGDSDAYKMEFATLATFVKTCRLVYNLNIRPSDAAANVRDIRQEQSDEGQVVVVKVTAGTFLS